MSPDFLPSSYKKYKDDTNVFTTWLDRTAKDCGYISKEKNRPEPAPFVRHTADAQGLGPDEAPLVPDSITTVKYAVSTQDMIAQADAIYNHIPKIYMPYTVKAHLKQAIDARQRCSAWYEKAEDGAMGYDSGGHRFFITMLQDALLKLSDHKDPPNVTNEPAAKKLFAPDTNTDTIKMENRFSHLNIEDADQTHHPTPTETSPITTQQTPHDTIDEFELEEDKKIEEAFAVFCFFEDLHRMRERLRKTWKDCESGEINILTATAVTQASILVSSRAERELCSTFFPDEPVDGCYGTLSRMMVTEETLEHPEKQALVYHFDESIFLPTARAITSLIRGYNLAHKMETRWPVPMFSLRLESSNVLDDMNIIDRNRLESDNQILCQLLQDLLLVEHGLQNDARYEDIFLRALRPALGGQNYSTTVVFASRILLDIIETSKNLRKYASLLTFAGEYVSNSTDPTGSKWPLSEAKTLTAVNQTIRRIRHPVITSQKRFYREQYISSGMSQLYSIWAKKEGRELSMIEPAEEDDFLVINDPMFSGSIMLKLLVEYQEAGLALANYHMAIFVVSHIYNALRQLKMLDHEWPLMERIIELHKRALFAGDIPRETNTMADRIYYRLNLADNQKLFRENRKFELREPPSTQVLRSLLDIELSAERALWQLEQQMGIDKMAPEAFVGSLQDMISQAVDDAAIDYVRLSKWCLQVAKAVRSMWKVQAKHEGLVVPLNFDEMWDEADVFGYIRVCAQVLGEAKRFRASGVYTYRPGDGAPEGLKGKHDDPDNPIRHGRGMLVAKKVFTKFLAKEIPDFKFPLAPEVSDSTPVAPAQTPVQIDTVISTVYVIKSNAELQSHLSDAKYVVAKFTNDEDEKNYPSELYARLVGQCGLPPTLTFVQVNRDKWPRLAKKHSKGAAKRQTFVFFKDGRRFAVNGREEIPGSDVAGWQAAIEKLGKEARMKPKKVK
ncbi:hypothetical protein F4818DRAFT_455312 [Hypoxylon cercidicola]|nr:hypothetical protein F4818DRAFT_455312 [Hypoxylon cercidicola]